MHQFRRLLKIILLVTPCVLMALAGDIKGKWSGILEIDQGVNEAKIERPLDLYLEQKDGALSGKIGLSTDTEGVEIRNCKLEADVLTFEASSTQASAAMRFTLTIQGDQMRGEMKGVAAGNDLMGKVSLTRVPK